MRKSTIVIALLVGTLASGCGNNQMTQDEQRYIAEMRTNDNVTIAERTDENLLELGKYTCQLFDNGTTPSAVIEEVIVKGGFEYDPEAMDYIISNAVVNLCSQHIPYLDAG